MSYGVKLHVWGEYACFTRPEMKVERVSYDVMTPSAARGILEAVHWKPAIRWVIDRIHVLNPIRFENIRKNEVGAKITARNARTAMAAATTAMAGPSQRTASSSASSATAVGPIAIAAPNTKVMVPIPCPNRSVGKMRAAWIPWSGDVAPIPMPPTTT